MEEEIIKEEKSFTLVVSKSDLEILMAGLGELPARISYSLLKKIEMITISQSKESDK